MILALSASPTATLRGMVSVLSIDASEVDRQFPTKPAINKGRSWADAAFLRAALSSSS